MPPAVTAFALDNAPILRELAKPETDRLWGSIAGLARLLERDKDNLRKTLLRLADDGLVGPAPILTQLTDQGANAVRLLDQLDAGEAGEGAPAPEAEAAVPPGFALLNWHQIEPDPLNPRKHFDDEAIEELAASIERDGLLENLVVRPGVIPDDPHLILRNEPAPIHRLVAGERRHHAIGKLIARRAPGWPADTRILCKVVDIDDADHRRIALVENLQRKDLRPIDEAKALQDLMQVTGQGTAEVASEIGFTQRFVQQRLQLLGLPPIKQVEVNEGRLTIEGARQWIAAQPKPLQLGATQALVLMEVAWAISAQKGADRFSRTPIDYHRPRQAPEAAPGKPLIHFDQDGMGRETARLGNAGWDHLVALAGGDAARALTRDPLDAHVRAARLAMQHPDLDGPAKAAEVDSLFREKRFMTAWLNPPFEIDPAWKREQARQAAERERIRREDERRRAEEEARRRARDEADRENSRRAERIMGAVRMFEERAAEPGVDIARKAEALMMTLGYEGPFSVAWDGQQPVLRDVHGVEWSGSDQLVEGLRRVMAIAVNHMLGLPLVSGPELPDTPWAKRAREEAEDQADEEDDERPLTREAYIGQIADRLLACDDVQERVDAIDLADKALDALLERNGLTFGDPDELWDCIQDDLVQEIADALADVPPTPAEADA